MNLVRPATSLMRPGVMWRVNAVGLTVAEAGTARGITVPGGVETMRA